MAKLMASWVRLVHAQRRSRRRALLLAAAVLPLTTLLVAVLPGRGPVVRQPNALDRAAEQWVPAPLAFVARDFTFHPDQVRPPTPPQIARWRAAYPLVRPIPYPYFVGLSIPSDCCGSSLSDLYYTSSLISRRFGLDCPSSFWAFTCQPSPGPALYTSDHIAPAHGPIAVEGDLVDRLPLLLTYYYRGWIDHLHQWSGESGAFYSLLTPRTVTVDQTGVAAVNLETGSLLNHGFLGLELQLEVDARICSFELELIDAGNQSHFVTYGRGLDGRPGWDLSARSRTELRQVFVHRDAESNGAVGSSLGQVGKTHLLAARVTAAGAPGATLTVQLVRPFDLTRASVRRHMEAMRSLNLLPICCTNHGGNSSWSQLDDWNYPYDVTDAATGHVFHLERPPLGATRSSPSYCADLLDDFGIAFHSQVGGTTATDRTTLFTTRDLLRVWTRADGRRMYLCPRWDLPPTPQYPDVTPVHYEHFENLGGNIVRYLARYDEFGQHWVVYTHFSIFNGDAFTPPADLPRYMSDVRRLHPYLERALATLACMKYDLDGRRIFYQRVWCCPLSVALRFAQAQRGLTQHARLEGDHVYITPWQDEVTGQPFPDGRHASQDLHGQTFYVPDAQRARVFCGGVEITSLRRNPPDFTGRPSVSIVDTETPTLIFGDLPLEVAGGVTIENGRLTYPAESTTHGQRCLRLGSGAGGTTTAVWTPHRLDNHETECLQLSYRKTSPTSVMTFAWTDAAGQEYVVTEGSLGDRVGWEIGPHTATGYREVLLDYADLHGPAGKDRRSPRGGIKHVHFVLHNAGPGDVVDFDRIAFLAARGVRVEAGGGVVLGGRLSSRADGVIVEARGTGQNWQTVTTHGGWYMLTGVPREQGLEIAAIVDGRRYAPERGRRVHAVRNDLELHIDVTPRRDAKEP